MDAMRSKMADGATFIISGFYEEDIPLLVDKASSLGLSLKAQKEKGNWRCLVFVNE
jgi:ribosomal protein L11 methyltransferase